MPSNQRLVLSTLPELWAHQELREASARLHGAHACVQGLFDSLHKLRQVKIEAGQSLRRLTHSEVDLLRAGLVFAGAGVDASLKQLVRDALPALLREHPGAAGPLKAYAVSLVDDSAKVAKSVLRADSIEKALREAYLQDLTKGSLQGTSELKKVRNALTLKSSTLLSDELIDRLDPFFDARNQIVHELDLRSVERRGEQTRRVRQMDAVREQCDLALLITADFIRETDDLMSNVRKPVSTI